MVITAKAENGKARIEIIGLISQWKDSAISFRQSIQDLIDSGITDATIYINSGGGECIDANEIVNEIRKFPGKIIGEGGALIASAATYIAIACDTFDMAENGQFMIHQPRGGGYGTVDEVESALSLLKNMKSTYYDAYLAKTTLKPAEFKAKWDSGDFWMTAKDAKANGFVNNITAKAKIDKATAQMITACGFTGTLDIEPIINEKEKDMADLKAYAVALGLSATATDEEITEKIAENKGKAEKADGIIAADKARKTNEINATVDQAIKDKKITADQKANWVKLLTDSFETAKPMLDALQAVVTPDVKKPGANGPVDLGGTTFEKLQEENPEALLEMEEKEPEKFKALWADFEKRNKLNK